jgi:hypothetical protein
LFKASVAGRHTVLVLNSKTFGCTVEQNAVNFSCFLWANSKSFPCAAKQNAVLLLAIPKNFSARQNELQTICVVLVGKFQKLSLRGRTKF